MTEYHFWIYFKQESQAILIRDRLALLQLQQKYSGLLLRMKENFNENIKKNLVGNLIQKLIIFSESKQQQNLQSEQQIIPVSTYKFIGYENQSIAQLISLWRDKVQEGIRKAKKKLFIEITSIKLSKKLIPQQVYCKIANLSQEKFQYSKSSDHHLIYEQKKKVYIFQTQDFYRKNLKFQINTFRNGKKHTFTTEITFQKIQNFALGFSYELGLTPANDTDMEFGFKGSFPYLLCFEAVVRSVELNMTDLVHYRRLSLLQNLGKIPNSYSSYSTFPYNPNNFELVQSIVNNNQYPLTKQSFQKTYLNLVQLIQHEQNKSRNNCLYISTYKKNLQQNQYCYRMSNRYQQYYKQFKIVDVKSQYRQLYIEKTKQFKYQVNSIYYSNLKQDIQLLNSQHQQTIYQIMKQFLVLIDLQNQLQQKISQPIDNGDYSKNYKCKLRYTSSMVNICQHILTIVLFSRQSLNRMSSIDREKSIRQDTLWLMFGFIQKLFPYSIIENLKLQLFHIRVLVQKYLPQFGRTLNRKGIGLQNFIAPHLLELFSSLNLQLTLRIWDLLINVHDPFKTRIIISYTLLLFLEKSQLLPIIPTNKFIISVRQNLYKIKLETSYVYHFSKNLQAYTHRRKKRQKKILEIAQEKYLKRFILSKGSKNLPVQDDNRAPDIYGMNKLQTRLLSLNQLRYPLPQPNYPGTPLKSIQIIVHSLFILENINLNKQKHILILNYGKLNRQMRIQSKNVYLNWQLSFPYNSNQDPLIAISIFATKESEHHHLDPSYRLIMKQSVYFDTFHQDKAYHINLNLMPQTNQVSQRFSSSIQLTKQPFHNKGDSTISLILCLKSKKSKQKLQQKFFKNELILKTRLLDYQFLADGNDGIKNVQYFLKKIQKMKKPLDQFNKQQYSSLQIGLNIYQDPWIQNSKVTIQQLKAIFYTIFYQENQSNLRLQFSIYYQLFTQQRNYKEFDFGLFLLEMILVKDLARHKKITLIYCLLVHYQNCKTKNITIQTFNSLIRQINKQHSFLNACQNLYQFKGSIQQGYFYIKGNKIQEYKKDITHILQDWAYICQVRYHSQGIILGSNQDLCILRSLFTNSTLQQILKNQLIRFEIIYNCNSSKYLWSMTCNTSDFTIKHRGIRFLKSYPKYQEIQYLDSTAEVLLNCQNIISLQSNHSFSFEQFSKTIKENTLLNYLISQPVIRNKISNKKIQIYKQQISERKQIKQQRPGQLFNDYAIYRHNNCIQEWKKCRIQRQQQQTNYCIVSFIDRPKVFYKIQNFEIINMSQNLQWEKSN